MSNTIPLGDRLRTLRAAALENENAYLDGFYSSIITQLKGEARNGKNCYSIVVPRTLDIDFIRNDIFTWSLGKKIEVSTPKDREICISW